MTMITNKKKTCFQYSFRFMNDGSTGDDDDDDDDRSREGGWLWGWSVDVRLGSLDGFVPDFFYLFIVS